MVYGWLIELGKAVSYYNEKALIKKDPMAPLTARETEKRAPTNDAQKEIVRLQAMLKDKDKALEELKEENSVLKTSNVKAKAELKQFQVRIVPALQDQFLTLMKLLEKILNDETLAVPAQLPPDQFKF